MDKIWDRKVGGRWPLWRGRKNRMTTQKIKKQQKKQQQNIKEPRTQEQHNNHQHQHIDLDNYNSCVDTLVAIIPISVPRYV